MAEAAEERGSLCFEESACVEDVLGIFVPIRSVSIYLRFQRLAVSSWICICREISAIEAFSLISSCAFSFSFSPKWRSSDRLATFLPFFGCLGPGLEWILTRGGEVVPRRLRRLVEKEFSEVISVAPAEDPLRSCSATNHTCTDSDAMRKACNSRNRNPKVRSPWLYPMLG